MKVHYRDRVELVAIILQICRTPTIKSVITRNANISYNALQPFMVKLENLGFVRREPSDRQFENKSVSWAYVTTPEGLDWIKLTEPWCKIMSKI